MPPELLARPGRDELRHVERDDCALIVDDYLRRLVRTDACCRRVLGRIAYRFTSARQYERLCFMRLSDYTRERLGISARELQAIASAGAALDRLPALAAAFAAGEVSWSHVRLLAAVAAPETDAPWVQIARTHSVRALESVVRRWQRGDPLPGTDGSDVGAHAAARRRAVADELAERDGTVDGEPLVRFRLLCPRHLCARWRVVVELARRMAGAPLSWWRAAEAIAAEALSAASRRSAIPDVSPAFASFANAVPATAVGERGGEPSLAGGDAPAVVGSLWADVEGCTPEHVTALGEGTEALDAFDADDRMREVLSVMRRIDWQTGRLLRLCSDLRLYFRFDCTSFAQYLRERLGCSAEKARTLIVIERATWRCSALMDAYQQGAISAVRALVLLPILTEGNGPAWIQRAREVTVRRLADEVEWALSVRDVSTLSAPVLPPDAGVRLEHDFTQMCARPGARGIDADITFRGPASVVALLREAIIASAEPGDLPWRACERLLEHVHAEWSNQPRHRDPIFARDGWRCAVPACSGRRGLHDHHVVFRSHGGNNARSNRVTVCAAHHHRSIHRYEIRAWGLAPDDIHWEIGVRRDGPPLLRFIGDWYVDCSP